MRIFDPPTSAKRIFNRRIFDPPTFATRICDPPIFDLRILMEPTFVELHSGGRIFALWISSQRIFVEPIFAKRYSTAQIFDVRICDPPIFAKPICAEWIFTLRNFKEQNSMQLRLGNDTLIEFEHGSVLGTADNRSIHSQHWMSLTLVRLHPGGVEAGFLLIEEYYHDNPELFSLLPPPRISFHATLADARQSLSNHDIVARLFGEIE